jgi:hypothetical protein
MTPLELMSCYGRTTIRAWSRRTMRWAWGQSMLCHCPASWEAAPTEVSETRVSGESVVICFASLIVSPSSLVMKDQMEVCPLSREGLLLIWAHPLSAPLPSGVRFFHPPLPAPPWESLARLLPFRERYGLTTFCTRAWAG